MDICISQTIHAVVLIAQCMMSSPEVMHHCACVLSFMSWFIVNIDTKRTWCRLVWNRIWAVLSDFFVNVCCHQNLNIAIYAVDSLRQLAMKFLERDELANYSFQNDFMKPFVIVMRQSKAVEIRELIIRCVQHDIKMLNHTPAKWLQEYTTCASISVMFVAARFLRATTTLQDTISCRLMHQ